MYNLHEAYLDVYYDLNEAPFNDRGEFIRQGKEAPERPELPASMAGRRPVPAMTYVERRRIAAQKSPEQIEAEMERRRQLAKGILNPEQNNEQLDLYDLIFDYLLDEGYADTEQAAEKIISVMSEEWIDNIFEVLSPEEKAKRRAASQARRQALGIPEKTPEETAEIMGRVRQRGARTRGQVPASSSLNLAPVSVGRQTTAQDRAGAQADKILSSPDNRTTSTGAPTAAPTYINADGERKTLASSGGTLTYTMRKVNPGQRPSQQVRDFTGDITNRNLQLRKSPNER